MRAAHQPLLNALTTLPDLQTSWLLLLYCASPRAHYALRGIRPDLTGTYATAHDAAVIACLAQLLDHQHGALPEHASHRAHLALDQGGLGLRSAHHHTAAAYWASWHDVAPIIQRKSPNLFTHITEQLTTPVECATPSIQCLQHVQEFLRNLGLEAPAWAECAPPGPPTQAELPQQLRGCQQAASKVIDQAYANFVEASADPAGQALLESQRGPHASRTFTLLPTSPELLFEPAHFPALLLRRLRLPLPHTTARCRCHRPHDQLADHRAACPHSGALRTRGMALEKAMARVCRKAGAAVSTNVLVRDLNTTTHRTDERRIEVIANALPFSATRCGHDPGVPSHSFPGSPIQRCHCRSSPPDCPQKQSKNIPRVDTGRKSTPCCVCDGIGRALERRSGHLHQNVGPAPSQRCQPFAPQGSPTRMEFTMDSPTGSSCHEIICVQPTSPSWFIFHKC